MTAARRAAVIAIALGTTFAGCALVSPPQRETSTAVLSRMPVDIPRRKPGPVTLLVHPPEARAAYDTTRMAYSPRPQELAYFRQHEWAAPPSQMLQPLLIKTLEGTGYLRAVLTPPHPGPYSYALRTEIVELVQDLASEPAALRLALRLRLSNDASGRLVATKEISLREPMREKSPAAGAAAANDAVAKALAEIAGFVLEKAN